MNENYTYDYINGTDVYLYQDKRMFRINTDTSLLATFMCIHEGERIMDIGTNNGALLAVAARAKPAYMYGIDIQEEAVLLARKNMELHHLKHVEIVHGDVCTTELPCVDVIVCNPPYFQTQEGSHTNETPALRIARHEMYLTLDMLANKVSSLLSERGRFYMVHRANRITDILSVLRQYRLEVKTIQFVYDAQKTEAITVLIEAFKDGKVNCHVLPPLTIKR